MRSRSVAAVLVVAAAAGVIATARHDRGAASAEFVEVAGYLERDLTVVITRTGGVVQDVLVKRGETVAEGQVLARFEQPELTSRYREMRRAFGEIAKGLDAGRSLSQLTPEARDWLIQNNPEVRAAEREYAEAASADLSNAEAKARWERATRDRTDVRRKLARAFSAAELTGGSSAKYLADQAKAALDRLESQVAELEVRAPHDGVIEAVAVQAGDSVSPGHVVAALEDSHHYHLETSLAPEVAMRFHEGAQVAASLGGEVLRAEIASLIKLTPAVAEGAKPPERYRMRLRFIDSPTRAGAGERVTVKLRVAP